MSGKHSNALVNSELGIRRIFVLVDSSKSVSRHCPMVPNFSKEYEMNAGGYLFKAVTSRNIKPEKITNTEYGEHSYSDLISATRQKVRAWSFETKENRDKFLKDVSSGYLKKINK